jgi:hypothetical protein
MYGVNTEQFTEDKTETERTLFKSQAVRNEILTNRFGEINESGFKHFNMLKRRASSNKAR